MPASDQPFSRSERSMIRSHLSGTGGGDPSTIEITGGEVTTRANRTGEFTDIVEIQVPRGYIYAFPGNKPIQAYFMVHEQFNSSVSAGQTYELDHNIVEAPNLGQRTGAADSQTEASGHDSLVLYDNGTQVLPEDVDFDEDEFTYQSDNADNDLDVYYTWGESSELRAKTYTTDFERHEQVMGTTVRKFHQSNLYNRTERETFANEFALNEKEWLKIEISTGVDLDEWDAISADGPNDTSSYSYFQLPVYKLSKSRRRR